MVGFKLIILHYCNTEKKVSRKFTSVQNEENCQITSENADLHFINYLVIPLPYLLQCFDKRKSHQKDTWLIYIGTQTKEEVLKEFIHLKLDFNDDVFLLSKLGDYLDVCELYKLAPGRSIESQTIGNWSQNLGLQLTTIQKWHRRMNMKVNALI